MSRDVPTQSEITNRIRTDIENELPSLDPYNPQGSINADAVAYGGRHKEIYDQLDLIERDAFVTTAQGQALLDRATAQGLSPNPATGSKGAVTFTGSAGEVISSGTQLQSSNGQNYTTDSEVTLSAQNIGVTSVTRAGSVATATVASGHGLGSGMTVTIAGANEPEYNGAFVVTVTGLETFTYEVAGTPITPATGTITFSFTGATAQVSSVDTGQATNVAGGQTLTLTTAQANVDSTVYTQFNGLDGGTDVETPEELRDRTLFKIQNPATNFNDADIINQAREVSGVTRVWVYSPDDSVINGISVSPSSLVENGDFVIVTFSIPHGLIDGMEVSVSGANEAGFNGLFRVLRVSDTQLGYYSPTASGTATGSLLVNYGVVQLGQVAVYFVRDNDASLIPSAQEVTEVKNKILEIKPAHTADNDVFVRAPIEKSQSFIVSSLSPNTEGIRNSIQANLKSLFEDADLGGTITESQYKTAIQVSFDPETNTQVQTFDTDVSGDLTSDYNEILTLGTVSFS